MIRQLAFPAGAVRRVVLLVAATIALLAVNPGWAQAATAGARVP